MARTLLMGLVFVLMTGTAATAGPIAGTLEGCGEDITCTETFYQLGEQLFMHEQAAIRTVGPVAEACMKADIEGWNQALRTTCMGNACVEAASWDRLATLTPLQPGVTRITGRELPEVAELVAVLGPETGMEPADSGEPLEIAGTLLHASDHSEHMGIAVDAGEAAPHVVTFDMDIGNQPGHQTLMSLIEADPPGTRFHVSGRAQVAPDGVANFDTEQCRFVYRLPKVPD